MYKILAVNNLDEGSTGNIASSILQGAQNLGFEVLLACVNPKRKDVPTYNLSSNCLSRTLNHAKARLFDSDGFCSTKSTSTLIDLIKREKPDVLHLHNLHDYYLNIDILITFLKKTKIKVVWTFHDCWAFTGKCPNFIHNNCSKWQKDCSNCPAKFEYPKSYLLCNSKKHLKIKKALFEDFKNLTIVCPSYWMESQVKKSIAKNCNIVTIHNGIHSDYFFENKLTKDNKYISIISAAYPWTPYKRLDIIEETAKSLEKYSNIRFVVAGIKKKDKINITYYKKLDRGEIIALYDKSTLLFNPSIEESFGLTNVEAQARGIPAIIAKNSGGSEETIIEGETGISINIDKKDFSLEILDYLKKITNNTKRLCIKNAMRFSNDKMVENYLILYKKILNIKE